MSTEKKYHKIAISETTEYTGMIAEGIPHGIGKCTQKDKNIVSLGSWSKGEPFGFVRISKDAKPVYVGEFQTAMEGKGTVYNEDSSITCMFSNGEPKGICRIRDLSKDITKEGMIIDGRLCGPGTSNYKDIGVTLISYFKDGEPDRFIISKEKEGMFAGEYKNGKKTGVGLEEVKSGDTILQEFSTDEKKIFYHCSSKSNPAFFSMSELDNGVKNGSGWIKTDSFEYIGGFKEDMFNGLGKLITRDFEYIGNFLEGRENGIGFIKSLNSYKYFGEWKEGLKSGVGIETTPQEVYKGEFGKGDKHGQGILTILEGEPETFPVTASNDEVVEADEVNEDIKNRLDAFQEEEFINDSTQSLEAIRESLNLRKDSLSNKHNELRSNLDKEVKSIKSTLDEIESFITSEEKLLNEIEIELDKIEESAPIESPMKSTSTNAFPSKEKKKVESIQNIKDDEDEVDEIDEIEEEHSINGEDLNLLGDQLGSDDFDRSSREASPRLSKVRKEPTPKSIQQVGNNSKKSTPHRRSTSKKEIKSLRKTSSKEDPATGRSKNRLIKKRRNVERRVKQPDNKESKAGYASRKYQATKPSRIKTKTVNEIYDEKYRSPGRKHAEKFSEKKMSVVGSTSNREYIKKDKSTTGVFKRRKRKAQKSPITTQKQEVVLSPSAKLRERHSDCCSPLKLDNIHFSTKSPVAYRAGTSSKKTSLKNYKKGGPIIMSSSHKRRLRELDDIENEVDIHSGKRYSSPTRGKYDESSVVEESPPKIQSRLSKPKNLRKSRSPAPVHEISEEREIEDIPRRKGKKDHGLNKNRLNIQRLEQLIMNDNDSD